MRKIRECNEKIKLNEEKKQRNLCKLNNDLNLHQQSLYAFILGSELKPSKVL